MGERSLSDDIKTDILIVCNCPAQVSVKSDSTNESVVQKVRYIEGGLEIGSLPFGSDKECSMLKIEE